MPSSKLIMAMEIHFFQWEFSSSNGKMSIAMLVYQRGTPNSNGLAPFSTQRHHLFHPWLCGKQMLSEGGLAHGVLSTANVWCCIYEGCSDVDLRKIR